MATSNAAEAVDAEVLEQYALLKKDMDSVGMPWTEEQADAIVTRLWGPRRDAVQPLPDVGSMALEDMRRELLEVRPKVAALTEESRRYRDMVMLLLEKLQNAELKEKIFLKMVQYKTQAAGNTSMADEGRGESQLPSDME